VPALPWDEIDRRAVDTACVLAADAVEKGRQRPPRHRDEPRAAGYLLYQRVMRHDPADTQ
jgi:transketolase